MIYVKNKKPPQQENLGAFTLGERLRTLREERGMTLKEVGNSTGLSFTYLSEIERNSVCPAVDTVRQLADFFQVPVSTLINGQKKTSLPSKLKYMRKLKKISQKELAQRADISPGLIAQLELGKVNASLKTVNKLAEALGVSVCYLIMDTRDIEGIMTGISPELRSMLQDSKVQAVIGSVCTLDEPKLKLILNFINIIKNPLFE